VTLRRALVPFALSLLGCSPSAPVPAAAPPASGRLAPALVQRVVRENFSAFRACYEDGLRTNPSLTGRVSVRFVIGRDGLVSNVGNGGSSMPDGGVVSCVVRSFHHLAFPPPEGGVVTVTYPIMFEPGGAAPTPQIPVAGGLFQGCEVSREDAAAETVVRVLCEGYTVTFEEVPASLSEGRAGALLGQFERNHPRARIERGRPDVDGSVGWRATATDEGVLWARVLAVPLGEARYRIVQCVARPSTTSTVEACERAIAKLATGDGVAEILRR